LDKAQCNPGVVIAQIEKIDVRSIMQSIKF